MKKVEVNPVSQPNLTIQEKSTLKAPEGWLSYFQAVEDIRGKRGTKCRYLSTSISCVKARSFTTVSAVFLLTR